MVVIVVRQQVHEVSFLVVPRYLDEKSFGRPALFVRYGEAYVHHVVFCGRLCGRGLRGEACKREREQK